MAEGLDVSALHAALNEKRKSKGLSWRQLATEAGVSPSTLTRMGQGKRPDVDSFASLLSWLGLPAERFLRQAVSESTDVEEPEPLAMISTFLRARKELSPESIEALEDLIRAAYEMAKKRT